MYGDRGKQMRYFFHKDGIPVTLAFLLFNVLTFFLILGLPKAGLEQYLSFFTNAWPRFFWTAATWPLSAGHESPLDLVFAIGWFYLFAGSLERSWGSRDFGVFAVTISAVMAISVWLGSFVFGVGYLTGLWVISGPATVAWAVINRREQLSVFFIPLPAPVIALLGAAIVWYHAGAAYGNPLIGLVALVGCGAAYWYAAKGRYGTRGYTDNRNLFTTPPRKNQDHSDAEPRSFSLARYLRARREKRSMEDLFRRSGYEDRDRR